MDEYITVAVFVYPHEVAVSRARLEHEGIPCTTKDENIVSAHPFYSGAVGGVKLQVPREHMEEAQRILSGTGAWQADLQEGISEADEEEASLLGEDPTPTTSSTNGWLTPIIAIVLLLALWFVLNSPRASH
jgi:Putative prokaryotic signal transducing protein